MRKRLSRTLDASRLSGVARHVADLDGGLETSDLERASAAAVSLKSLAGHALAARQQREWLATLGAMALAAAVALGVRARVFRVLPGPQRLDVAVDTRDRRSSRRSQAIVLRFVGPIAGPGRSSPPSGRRPWPRPIQATGRARQAKSVGVPGDRIAMHGGAPVINGWEVPSCNAGPYLYVLPDGNGALQGLWPLRSHSSTTTPT